MIPFPPGKGVLRHFLIDERPTNLRFSKTALMGAGLGFVMGIAFTVIALIQYDRAETDAKDVVITGLLIGLPFSVLIGLAVGGLWSRFMGPSSL